MFTGLVQKVGTFERLARSGGGWRLTIGCTPWDTALELGESVAVQGACLTVVEATAGRLTVDVLDETYRRTALASLTTGAPLNLERALRLGDRLGGHLVSGHVDETGVLRDVQRAGRDWRLTVSCSPTFARQTVLKGSVALDGVSLTVTALADEAFSVDIIPHTWEATSLAVRRPGDRMNLESDLIGKYVARCLESRAGGSLTVPALEAAGFGSP